MTDAQWRQVLTIARRTLGRGANRSWASESWCAWTTFASLQTQIVYWSSGLPEEEELMETYTKDGGTWMQPFSYSDIAHLLIPATFYWEGFSDRNFEHGEKMQNIALLSERLNAEKLPHRLTDLVLEIKLY